MNNKKVVNLLSRGINQEIRSSVKFRPYFLMTLLFLIAALYFLLFGNYVFFYQEKQTLFIFSGEYLNQFASKPGGLLEYAGNFLTQGYYNIIYGSLILSVSDVLLAIIFLKIIRKISPDTQFLYLFAVLPSSLLILMQTNYNYQIHNTLGFLLLTLYFMFSIVSERKPVQFILIAFFPVFYYVTGAYALIFLGMYISGHLINKRVIYPFILLLVAIVVLILSWKVFFFQPFEDLLHYPVPLKEYFISPVFFYLPVGLFIIYPALIRWVSLINLKEDLLAILPVYTVLIVFSLTVFIQSRLYNRNDANLFEIEKLFYSQDWEGVVSLQENLRLRNAAAQYYYNTALSEKDQLCDRMFFGPQDFGPNSLLIQWNSGASINDIFRGAYFFYAMGLINEAHRWAFESMVVQGYRPENMKLLVKTNLINGHYIIAEKYIYFLKKTLHYRKFALKYEEMLNHPELIKADKELGAKTMLRPMGDFLIRIKEQQSNVMLLLESNPGNKRAFEYMMAWFMLERNTEKVAGEIKNMKAMGYTRLPRHIEEAALLFNSASEPDDAADFGGLAINPASLERFRQYSTKAELIVNLMSSGDESFKKSFGNTYWYYFGSR